eukprot:s4491_g6.t1
MWPSGQAMVAEFEKSAGPLSADQAFSVAAMWTLALSRATTETHQGMAAVVEDRTSTFSKHAAPRAEPGQPSKIVTYRKLISAGGTTSTPSLTQAAASDAHARQQAARVAKLDALFQMLMEDVVDAAELGLTVDNLTDAGAIQSLKESLMSAPSQLSTERFKALMTALKRWKRFAIPKTYSVRAPTPLQLAEFLREVSRGGPTAAASRRTPTLGVGVNLLFFARRQRGTNLVLTCFLLQCAVSCVRFEHFQRSKIVATQNEWAKFWCSQGKRRVRGARPGYECDPQDLWEITEGTPFEVAKPMSRQRFLEVMRGALHQIGVPIEESTTAGFNRLRRFMPTLANTLRLEDPELQAIGSWVEVPGAGGPVPTKKSRAVWLMGRHYSGGQTERSAFVKRAILQRFWQLFHLKRGELALTDQSLLPRGSWTWQELAAANDRLGPLEIIPIQTPDAPPLRPLLLEMTQPWRRLWTSRIKSTQMLPVLPPPLPQVMSVLMEGVELLDVVVENTRWIKQGNKVHVVKHLNEDARPVPWCRDFAFSQDPKGDGVGFGTSSRQAFCQRCLARMPRAVYSAVDLAYVVCGLQLGTLAQSCLLPPPQRCVTLRRCASTMSAAARIDVMQNDRGLKTCFDAANIEESWAAAFCKVHKITTLDDYVYLMDSKDWEQNLRELLNAFHELKENRLILSRFKAAYESGLSAIKTSQTSAKAEESLDTVLPESTMQAVTKDFARRYGVVLDPHLDPSDSLRSRIYREFRRQTMTVLETRRVKSMLHVAVPKTTENIKLSESLQLQLQEDESIVITTAIEYYFALRTLCYAWAWSGNFEATDHDNSKKLFINLSDAQGYADFCLRMTVEVGQGSLQWLTKNDMLTRSRMASLIQRNYTAGSALKEALHQTHLEWRSPALQSSGSLPKAKALQPPPEPEHPPPPKRARQIKPDTRQTVTQVWSLHCCAWESSANVLAAESDPVARACAAQAMPQIVHVDAVERVQQYCKWMRSLPIAVNAASCGWTQRLRLFWLCSRRRGLAANLQPPESWQWSQQPTSQGIPELVYKGAKPIPARLQCDDGFQPLLDPLKVLQSAGDGAMHTFTREFYHPADRIKQVSPAAAARFEDDARRFPGGYEEHCLVWRQDQWRALLPAERAQLLGVPPAAIEAVPGTPDQKRQGRNSLLGNGFHLPSLIAILCLLPALLEAKLPPQPTQPDFELRARLVGTVWEPHRLEHFPDILNGTMITHAMQSMFQDVLIPDEVWADTRRRLDVCQLHSFQAYASWRRLRGDEWQLRCTRFAAGVRCRSPSPRAQPLWLASQLYCAGQISNNLFTFFRATPLLVPSILVEFSRLLHSRPPLHARDILDVTEAEIAKGFCGPLKTKLDLDAEFGQGQWRFLERFLIIQHDGKKRVIDNGRKSGHNLHTMMQETISTVTVDFVATVARMLCTHLSDSPECIEAEHPWCNMRLGTDDLPDAYRGLPVSEAHLRFSNVAIFVPDVGWRFTTLFGLAYGLEAAVVAFNRFPQLGVAVTRRCLLGCCAAYFDDELSIEFVRDAQVSQQGLKMVFNLMGAPPQPGKCYPPTANRHYLGTSVHVGDAFTLGVVRYQPKSSTQWEVLSRLHEAVTTEHLDRDTASKLRGDLNWMWSMCAGYIGRIAGPVLSDKQTSETSHLTPTQLYTLQLLLDIVRHAPPRDIAVLGPVQPLVHVYSDASFENGVLRIGWVIFQPTCNPVGGTCVVPEETLSSWCPRKQQIFPGEALAALLVPLLHPSVFDSQDVLWFIDNDPAVASLIRATSLQPDVHLICLFSHAWLFKRGARIWYEWIDSASNPSDGLSRDGLQDPWTLQQGWDVKEYPFPPELLPGTFFSSLLASLY